MREAPVDERAQSGARRGTRNLLHVRGLPKINRGEACVSKRRRFTADKPVRGVYNPASLLGQSSLRGTVHKEVVLR